MDQFNAYRELLFDRDIVIDTGPDADGNPVLVTVTLEATMSAQGAEASSRFFAPFAPGGTHEGYLGPHELRLLAEWLDIGAQYYNNPFDVPVH
jgi:hypothetical protein